MTKRRVDIRDFARLLKHTEAPFAGQPFIPSPWQDEYLDRLFNTLRPDGLRQYQRSLLAIPRKNGKALALDTPVLTAAGWKTMGTIAVGDEVFHPSGYRTRVVAVSDVMHDRPCYAVEFSQGDTIVADAEHLWETSARVDRPGVGAGNGILLGGTPGVRIRTTEEIARTCRYGSRGDRNHSVRVAAPLQIEDSSLPLDPYVLGVWLGDGTSATATVTVSSHETDVIDNLVAAGAPVSVRQYGGRAYTVRLGGIAIRRANRGLGVETIEKRLRRMWLLNNKHIPSEYLLASHSQRLSLFQGLMDTDGSIGIKGQAEFTSTSRRLAEDFAALAVTLGLKVSLNEGTAMLHGRAIGPKYRVQFTPLLPMRVFRMARKQARVKRPPATAPRCRTRQIVSCDKTDSVPVRCIQVEAADGMFLVGRSLIPTHNSSMCAVIGAYEGFFGAEGGQILIAAGDRKQASLLFTACSRYIESCPGLFKRAKIYKGSIVIPHTNSVIQFLSSEHRGKHGFNPSLVLVDEYHVQPNRDLVDVLESGMGARTEPLVIYVTTAGMDRVGPCYDEWQRAIKVRDGLINDPTFLPCIYGADDGDDFSDEAAWAKANPNYGITVRKEFMEREAALARESVAQEIKFRTLYLNQWVSNGASRFFRTGQWESCNAPLRPAGERPCYCGLDLSSTQDTTAFVAVWPCFDENGDPDGTYDVFAHLFIPEDNCDRDEAPYRQWAKDGFVTLTEGDITDYDAVRDYVLSFCEKNAVRGVAIDRWNATHITTQLVAEGIDVKPYGQGYASMSAPTKLLETLVLSRKIRHGGNPALALQVSNMQVRVDDAGNIKPTKQHSHSTARIDSAVAMIMALGIASGESHGPAEEPQLVVF